MLYCSQVGDLLRCNISLTNELREQALLVQESKRAIEQQRQKNDRAFATRQSSALARIQARKRLRDAEAAAGEVVDSREGADGGGGSSIHDARSDLEDEGVDLSVARDNVAGGAANIAEAIGSPASGGSAAADSGILARSNPPRASRPPAGFYRNPDASALRTLTRDNAKAARYSDRLAVMKDRADPPAGGAGERQVADDDIDYSALDCDSELVGSVWKKGSDAPDHSCSDDDVDSE